MPHLWMFLLQSLTPTGHEVLLIDGNAKPMDEAQIAQYVRDEKIDLVGIGAMTRMIAKAYRIADAIRATGVKVVMGGPHVTELADEALGRDGGPRHADAVALGEADETWPQIVNDAVRGELKEIYTPVDETGKERKPSLKQYPVIPWQSIDLEQFNLVPQAAKAMLQKVGEGWGTFRIIPVESGRGCPYGCEFCTVTGFFGDSIRFRTNESVVNELLLLKARARKEKGQMAVFFIDDNFAINVKRTKSLLRDIIAAGAQVHWVAQISANLLRDEELIDLIAASGGKWVFIGMESIDPANLKDVNKGFNKPGEYAEVLERLARRNVYAITSFIFGMDNDTTGVAERTLVAGAHVAAGTAHFWAADAVTGDTALQAAGGCGTADAREALAGVHPVRDGAHAAQDEHRRGARRSEIRMGACLQSRGAGPSRRFTGRPAAGVSHQYFPSADLFSRHLFPDVGETGLGESSGGEPAYDFQTGERSCVRTKGAAAAYSPGRNLV